MKKFILILVVFGFVLKSNAQVKHIITSDGVDLHVTVKGKGEPCLYLHGGPGSGSYWMEKFVGDSLEQHFQMIYLDQRGVARSSSAKDKNYSMDRMVQDFEEVRAALGIKQWVTMGHSFGGVLQMGYALRFPQSVKGMIMLNCGLNLDLSYKTSWCPKACEFLNITDTKYYEDETIALSVRWDSLIHALNEKDLMWKMGYSDRKNMEKMGKTFGEIPNWNWEFGSIAMSLEDYNLNFLKETSKIDIPVLFFYGLKDWMIGPDHYKEVQFPDVMFWGSDVGHMPFMENQADMMKAITAFQKKYNF